MRIQLFSDTHNRVHDLKISKNVDLVIHAGDIANSIEDLYDQTRNLDILCKEKNVDYLYVLGNHDMYSHGYPRPYFDAYNVVYDKSKLLTKDTGPKIINGYTFVGATLWTNTNLNIVERYINDFNYIYDENYNLISLDLMNKWFEEDWKYIQQFKNKSNTFIITHFPPSEALCAEQYKGNMLNPYFLNNLDLKGFENWFCGHCLTLDHEVLTKDGWKFRKDLLESDQIFTYSFEKDIVKLSPILEFHDYKYTGDLYSIQGKSISQVVTSKHRIIGYNQGKTYKEYTAEDFSKVKTQFYFIKSGVYETKGLPLSDKMLQLYIAINADGSPTYNSKNLIRFSLHKERKKVYIESLLSDLDISFKRYDYKNGRSSINFYLPEELIDFNLKGLDKKLLEITPEQFEQVLIAYSQIDGIKLSQQYIIYTSKLQEVDLLSYLGTINGYKTSFSSKKSGFCDNLVYTVYLKKQTTSCLDKPNTKVSKDFVQDFPVWCLTTNNSNFFIRHNGKVSLTGNSHHTMNTINNGCNLYLNAYGYVSRNGAKENLIYDNDYIIEI